MRDHLEAALPAASRTITVRAEMSRLRRHFAGILGHRPYRFADGVAVDLRAPEQPDLVLPHSAAPAVRGSGQDVLMSDDRRRRA